MKNLKKRLQNGEALIGCLLNSGNAYSAEIVGRAGFDWVMVDLEHGAGNEKDALSQLQTLQATPTGVIIRVESNNKQRVQRALDMGAEGIICPQVETVANVQTLIDGMYYYPYGKRGVAPSVRAANFGKDFKAHKEQSKENGLCIVQIETKKVLDNLDEITALVNVDALFIGPLDLTMALGIFGEYDHPKYIDAVEAVAGSATRAKKALGIYLPDPENYQMYYDLGFRLFACGTDTTFLAQGANDMAKTLNSKK